MTHSNAGFGAATKQALPRALLRRRLRGSGPLTRRDRHVVIAIVVVGFEPALCKMG